LDESRSTQTLRATSRALVVEFAGTPKAGKTTALDSLRTVLRNRGYKVGVVEEQAPSSPVRGKRDKDFNVWTVATTVARMVEAVHVDKDIVLVDRGVLDAMCWLDWHLRCGQLDSKERAAIDRFLLTRSETVDLVLLMTVAPDEALARDIASGRDRSASVIVSTEILDAINRSISEVRKRHVAKFNLVHLDTTNLDKAQTLADVVGVVDPVLTLAEAAGTLRRPAADALTAPPHL